MTHYLTTIPEGCTCDWQPARSPLEHPEAEPNPDCPVHGRHAGDQTLDIDTSYQEVASRHE